MADDRAEVERILAEEYGSPSTDTALTRGMRGLGNWFRNSAPPPQPTGVNTLTGRETGLRAMTPHNIPLIADVLGRYIPSGALHTSANWLDWTPRVGEDTVAPLGTAAFGLAPLGAIGSGALRRERPAAPVPNPERERAIQLGMEHLEDYRRRVNQIGPQQTGWRPGERVLTPDDIPGGRDALEEAGRRGLDMSDRARLERGYDTGYDLVVPAIHGTNREPFGEFRRDAPSSHDMGHYGEGTYIINRDPGEHGPGYGAINPGYGEAAYYGRNLYPMFVQRGRVLDLGNNTGDYTYPGHFRSWAGKLEGLGLLTPEHRETLGALRQYDDLLATAEMRGPFSDGTYQANVRRPGVEGDENRIYGVARSGGINDRPLTTPEQALETLGNTLFSEMGREQHYWNRLAPGSDGRPGAHLPNPIYNPAMDFNRFRTLEQAVMRDLYDRTPGAEYRSGSGILSDAAQRHGYGSIAYGDEAVLFHPEGMRHMEAAFNPFTNRNNLLSADPRASSVGSILAQYYGPPEATE